MEINYYLDDTWYMDYANVSGVEGKNISYHIEHTNGADFEIEISLENIKADTPVFELFGPCEYFTQIQEAFSGEHWEYWIKSVGLVVHSCYEIDAAQELNRKASMWDQIQQLKAPVPVLPTIDEACQREDAGMPTELDEFLVQFHMAGCEDSFRAYTAKLIQWLMPGKASVELKDSNPPLINVWNIDTPL